MIGVLVAATLAVAPAIYPHVAAPPRHVAWVDMRRETDFDIRVAAATAQGLINRQPKADPKVFLVWSDADAIWLTWLERQKRVEKATQWSSWRDAVRAAKPKGWLLYDDGASHLGDIATMVAACEDWIPTRNFKMKEEFGGKLGMDLGGGDRTNAEWYEWVIATYGPKLNRLVTSITVPRKTDTHNPAQLRDYLVAHRVFTFWLTGEKEQALPGADRAEEEKVVGEFLREKIGPNHATLGYPWSGDGYGPGEQDGVTFLSQNGQFLVPTDNFSNLSFWSLFPASTRQMPKPTETVRYEAKKKYASMVMSDGDNLCTWLDYFPSYFDGKWEDAVPVGWTMGPTLAELAPPVYDFAVQHLPPGHTVGSGVSGIGYISMAEFGRAYGPKAAEIRRQFAQMTGRVCQAIGQSWLWVMRYGEPGSDTVKAYAEVPGLQVVMGGYGRAIRDLSRANEWVGDVPFVHCVHDGGNRSEVKASLEKLLADPKCPQFLHVFLLNWNFKADDSRAMGEWLRGKGVEVVPPETLGSLMRSARK